MSNEHVWADWLKQVLPDIASEPESAHIGTWFDYRTGATEESRRTMPKTMLETQVRRPCRKCNSEWMSDIEVAAQPSLTRLIKGDTFTLSTQDQRSIATWAFKTTVMYEFVYPRIRAISREHQQFLFKHGAPPLDTACWLGQLEPLSGWKNRTRYVTCGLSGAREDIVLDNPNTYLATIGLGRLVIHIAGGSRPDITRLDWIVGQESTELLKEGGLYKVWPEPEFLQWGLPEQRLLRDDAVWELSTLILDGFEPDST